MDHSLYAQIDIPALIHLSRRAGEQILQVYQKDFAVDYKADHSPLTDADRLSNEVITSELLRMYPHIPIISEENKQLSYEERKNWHSLWLIDPLDGTKEFIKKNGEFTVNIALIENGVPTAGFVYAPVPDILYYGVKGQGSFKIAYGLTTQIHGHPPYLDKEEVRVVGSRSHMSPDTMAFVDGIKMKGKKVEFLSIGSSLKLCLVADGSADVYPRFGPTMEWDTAAAHAVALYAGHQVIHAHTHQPLGYNKPDLHNPPFIVC